MRAARSLFALALLCGAARAQDMIDTVEWRFAQAPASRDELFGAPAAAPPKAPPKAVPKTQDDLFGAPPAAAPKPAAAPASKDELFGAPPAPAAVAAPAPAPASAGSGGWSGFINQEAAYTVADPHHWSRAVTRLQLTHQGTLGGLKYKVSARVDGDLVHASSGFYPTDVREDQRFDFFLRENYVDFGVADLDVRLGRQQIVWGEVVGLFFADVVSGQDQRDFILPSFEIIRIPQWAARVEYFSGDFHAEAVWIPVQSFDNIGEPGAEFYPAGLMTRDLPNAVFRNVDEPSRSLDNSAYGLRLNTLVDGWDLAAFYYRSHTSAPTFYREVVGPDVVFTPKHDRIWKIGGTLSKDFGDFVLRGEAVYTDGQTYSVEDPLDADGVIERNVFEYIVGLDFSMSGDTRLNVQGFHRIVTGGDEGDIRPEVAGVGFTVLFSTKIARNWEPQLLWIQNLSVGDRLLRPRLNWQAGRNTQLSFGADIFAGSETGFFGRFRDRDRIYTELRHDF